MSPGPLLSSLALELGDVSGLLPFGSLHDLELHGLAFRECAEAGSLDRREMDEHIVAIRPRDEAIALRLVEPFHSSGVSQCVSPLSVLHISGRRAEEKSRKGLLATLAAWIRSKSKILEAAYP